MQRKADEPRSEEPSNEGQAGDEEDMATAEAGTMQVTADFDEMVVWGHEAVADAAGDPYVRSIEEWLQVSEKVSLAMGEHIEGEAGVLTKADSLILGRSRG